MIAPAGINGTACMAWVDAHQVRRRKPVTCLSSRRSPAEQGVCAVCNATMVAIVTQATTVASRVVTGTPKAVPRRGGRGCSSRRGRFQQDRKQPPRTAVQLLVASKKGKAASRGGCRSAAPAKSMPAAVRGRGARGNAPARGRSRAVEETRTRARCDFPTKSSPAGQCRLLGKLARSL
jgi:hypothetical protein